PVYSRAADPAILMAEADRLGKPGEVAASLNEALKKAMAMAGPEDLIVVSGSLYTVGEAMTFLDPETYRPDVI
ncbi:MAG: bifunctional folylpolyglutamate synthase/dihydrofolate synthase, partial [Deltaproteobacteria bacterium]|nr:bifunctional folylpolyglutamate synthase/dihydrofolate synthase [Deltaproteobacteria bacterium]